MSISLLLILAVFWVAYSNGANDNIKGVATLIGSGTTGYPKALILATVTTLLGSMAAMYVGDELIRSFSGEGLVPQATLEAPGFIAAVGIGAGATVLLATFLGLPISTTHALVGGLVGAGLMAPLGSLNLAMLGVKFFLPLVASPFLAVGLTYVAYTGFHRTRLALGVTRQTCLCVGEAMNVVAIEAGPGEATAIASQLQPTIAVADQAQCYQRYAGKVIGVPAQTILDGFHYLSAGAVSFARGLNDTPKIVGLLVAAQALSIDKSVAIALVGLVIAVGGILSARRVAETMSRKITSMNSGQGFAGNLVTALLVIGASRLGMPVSTTHVACGSLFGVGLVSGQGRWKTIAGIMLSWVVTLPVAAGLAALACLMLK